MAEITADIVEPVAEAAQEVVVESMAVVRNNPVLLAAAAAGGLVVGLGVGYFVTKRKLDAIYQEQLQVDSDAAKEFYKGFYKVDDAGAVRTPQSVMLEEHGEAAAAALTQYQGTAESIAEDEALLSKAEARVAAPAVVEETITKRVFETRGTPSDDEYDYDVEVLLRTPQEPYVVTHDEFFENPNDAGQATYTFYEGDNVLTNERDQVVTDTDTLVGDNNLARFGHGSKDANIVYIRNEALDLEFEILRSTGSYAREVLGFNDEPDSLQHGHRRVQRRRLKDDDG